MSLRVCAALAALAVVAAAHAQGEQRGMAEPAGAIFDPQLGQYRGTGVLVSRCHVLTNHHVAFPAAPEPRRRLEFRAGLDAPGRFRESVTATVVAWHTGFWPLRQPHQDWALLVLDRPLHTPHHARLLAPRDGLAAIDHLREGRAVLSLAYAFPAAPGRGTVPILHAQTCALRASGLERFTNCQVVPGHSGGPIMRERDGRLELVGLHATRRVDTAGAIPDGERDPRKWNRAVPLDPLSGNATVIARAIAEHPCPAPPLTAAADSDASRGDPDV